MEENPKLNASLRTLIENPAHTLLVSQFSLMELSIKLKLGKLPHFIISIEQFIAQLSADGFLILPITNIHISSYQAIPFFDDHRDPFDRFLLSVVLSEQIPLISVDDQFLRYQPLITIIS